MFLMTKRNSVKKKINKKSLKAWRMKTNCNKVKSINNKKKLQTLK